jgi:MFS family permease
MSEIERARRGPLVRIMVVMGLFMIFVQINRTAGGVLANELTVNHGMSGSDIGLIMGAMFLASGVMQIPFGLMYDKLGPRNTVTSMNLIAVFGILGFAFADSFLGLLTGRAVMGIGHGGTITAIYLLAVAWVPADRVATVTATVIAIAGGIGGVLSTAPLAMMLDWAGFEATFAGLAAMLIFFTFAIHILVRDRPPGAPVVERKAENLFQSMRVFVEVVQHPERRRILVMGVVFSAPFSTIGGLWAGPYMSDVHGLSKTDAGYVLLAMIIAYNIGTFCYGPLDRIFNSRKRVVMGGAMSQVVLLLTLAFAPSFGFWQDMVLLLLFAMSAPFFVVLAAHMRGFISEDRVGRAIALVNLTGVATIFFVQGSTGWIIDAMSADGQAPGADAYAMVFAVIAALVVMCLVPYSRVRDVRPFPD